MQLAYGATRFERAAWLLAGVVKAEQEDSTGYRARDLFTQLFWAVMPGTVAPPDQRLDFVDDLLASGDGTVRHLAVDALDAALKTAHFSSRVDIARFGGQSRSLGWEPECREQFERQFARAAGRLTSIAVSDDPLADIARSVLAHRLRELGANGFIHIVEETAAAVRARGFWAAGWGEICTTLRFGAQDMDERLRERLTGLERLLAPKTLDERFDAFVLHPYWEFYIPFPEEEPAHVDVRAEIETIAIELKDGGGPLAQYVRCATCPAEGDAALSGRSLVTAGFGIDHLFVIGVAAWEAVVSRGWWKLAEAA